MHRSGIGHSIDFVAGGGSDNGSVNVASNLNASTGALDSLPKQFVNSMKTLFDIMDDQKAGFVKLTDIEKGWQDDGSKGLPYGVIESLRKVSPANGLLSFDRFCTGLKICLLRNQAEQKVCRVASDGNVVSMSSSDNESKPPYQPSAPILDIDSPASNNQWPSNNTASIRPNNAIHSQRALSLPQLSPYSDIDILSDHLLPSYLYGPPPKPPRSAILAPPKAGFDKAEIRSALQNWQMGILMNEMDVKDKRKSAHPVPSSNRLSSRGTADGGSSTTDNSTFTPSPQTQCSNSVCQKKIVKRREPRRHTLQNGIDNNLLKRLKQFEAEKDVLLQGHTAVEQAREWYLKQIAFVQEKIKFLGHSGSHLEQWSEAHQERLDFQRARIIEINRHLSALQFSWERGGFPSHMNLAVHHRSNQHTLKQGNDSLSQLKT